MKKIILIAAGFITLTSAANAQNTANASSSAQQAVQLALSNALEITFTDNNSTTGGTVSIPFTTVTNYEMGVASSTTPEIKVRSNKNYDVTVKTDADFFSVGSGGSSTTSTMPASTLSVKVATNNTSGTIAGNFTNYTALSSTAANLITNGTHGGDQRFTVQYFAHPGFGYPAGTYAINVVYTATQN